MAIDAITIDPPMSRWPQLLREPAKGNLLGRSLAQWRTLTRSELNLPGDRPLIATGHQPTLWHPGILAKYIAVSALAQREKLSALNVVVDQDVADISGFDVPIRHSDGSLAARRVELRRPNPPADLPLAQQPAFDPLALPQPLHAAIESAGAGARLIHAALAAHATASSAAEQVASAFDDLMTPWVMAGPMPRVMATTLMHTTLAHALLQVMADDPRRCAETYNRAAASEPQARLTPLLVRDDYVELPLWRVRDDGRRIRAYDNDAADARGNYQSAMREDTSAARQSKIQNPKSKIFTLFPRALFMTALIRLAVSDLFIHGIGGALYDRATERWIGDWLGLEVAPMAVVSATLRLPLMSDEAHAAVRGHALDDVRRAVRRLWHDPESIDAASLPGPRKRSLLRAIEQAPHHSPERRAAFFTMHQHLTEMRRERGANIDPALQEVEHFTRLSRDAKVALRRDWAFPLYPRGMLDKLATRLSQH